MGAFPHRQDCRCRLVAVSLPPKLGKKRKADIDILKVISLYQAAHSYRSPGVLHLTEVQPKTESLIAVDRALQYVVAGIIECSDTLVADELQERGPVDELQNEWSIFDR